MDEKFQDRIDNYLLNRMNDSEKTMFLREVEQDNEKKEQLEFTQNVKDSIRSREEKLQALTQSQQQYEEERRAKAMRSTGTDAACYCSAPMEAERPGRSKKKIWLWISGVAAVLVVGFFAIHPMFVNDASNSNPMEQIRGNDGIFDGGNNNSFPSFTGRPKDNVRGDDEIYDEVGATPADTIENDTIYSNIDRKDSADE
ncbi:MAG: hypothetical protein Q4D36_00225 [Bacteroidales bacterium]|nr:hypothetical protein [Bacteroidales bacterium]